MARKVIKAYVDKYSRKIVNPGDFKGSDERFKELKELGFTDDITTYEDLTKEQIIEKLEEKNIEYNKKDNKKTLFKVLNGEE